jgi:hypothetical protein
MQKRRKNEIQYTRKKAGLIKIHKNRNQKLHSLQQRDVGCLNVRRPDYYDDKITSNIQKH